MSNFESAKDDFFFIYNDNKKAGFLASEKKLISDCFDLLNALKTGICSGETAENLGVSSAEFKALAIDSFCDTATYLREKIEARRVIPQALRGKRGLEYCSQWGGFLVGHKYYNDNGTRNSRIEGINLHI